MCIYAVGPNTLRCAIFCFMLYHALADTILGSLFDSIRFQRQTAIQIILDQYIVDRLESMSIDWILDAVYTGDESLQG